jgi:hypothetical protein
MMIDFGLLSGFAVGGIKKLFFGKDSVVTNIVGTIADKKNQKAIKLKELETSKDIELARLEVCKSQEATANYERLIQIEKTKQIQQEAHAEVLQQAEESIDNVHNSEIIDKANYLRMTVRPRISLYSFYAFCGCVSAYFLLSIIGIYFPDQSTFTIELLEKVRFVLELTAHLNAIVFGFYFFDKEGGNAILNTINNKTSKLKKKL